MNTKLKYFNVENSKEFINSLLSHTLVKNGISNSFWNILASIVMRGSFFIVGVIIARLLGSDLYGQFVFLKSTAQVFEGAVGIAFGITIAKYISSSEDNGKLNNIVLSNIFISLLLSLIIIIIFFIFSEEISMLMFHNKENIDLFKISLIYILFNNTLQSILGIFKGEQKFKNILIVNLFLAIVNLISTVYFTFFYSLTGAMLSFVFFSIIQFIVFTIFSIKYSATFQKLSILKFKFDSSSIKSLSVPLLISGFSAPIALWILNYLMSSSEGGFLELSYFNAAFQIFAIIVFIPISISDAIFPMLNAHINNQENFNKIVTYSLLGNLLISVLFSFPIYYFSDNIMNIYGYDFNKGTKALQWLALAAVFSSLLSFLGKVIISYEKAWLNLLFNFFWGAMVVFSTYLLLDIYPASQAVAISFVISYFLLFILQFLIVKIIMRSNQKDILR